MLNIINFIENEIKLSKGINEELDLLRKIALYMSKNKIEGKVDKIMTLIDMNTGYSEYRVINDCESDDKKLWIEYTDENDKVRLNPGDILIKMK